MKLTTKKLALQVKVDEEINLEDIDEVIFNKSVSLKSAQRVGDTAKINRIAGDIEQCQKIKDSLEEVVMLEKAKNGV